MLLGAVVQVIPSDEHSQAAIVPVKLLSFNCPELELAQTVTPPPDIVPVIIAPLTVTVAVTLFEQPPALVTVTV